MGFYRELCRFLTQLSKVDFTNSADGLIAEKTNALGSHITFRNSPSWSGTEVLGSFTVCLWVFPFHLVFPSHSFHKINVFI